MLTVWRADLLVREVWRLNQTARGSRTACVVQAVKLVNDLVALLYLSIISLTLCRLPCVIVELARACRRRPHAVNRASGIV